MRCVQSEILKMDPFCSIIHIIIIFPVKMDKIQFTFTNVDTLFPFLQENLDFLCQLQLLSILFSFGEVSNEI
jgi:hypothetical protein